MGTDGLSKPLRLGVMCAVVDDENRLLLSQRGDLNVWNLPGGRLDSGEPLAEAAAREVREETGIVAQVDRPVGLYYLAGWDRLNILYAGWPLGGELQQRTDETRANRYFSEAMLPDMLWKPAALDALSEKRPNPRIIATPNAKRRRIQMKLRWRWLMNLLRGRPEPRFPHFEVSAAGLVWDDPHGHVLTLPNWRLPRVMCDGQTAPWTQLAAFIQQQTRIETTLQWVGLWQDASRDQIELIFAATVEEFEPENGAEWVTPRTAALPARDLAYLERVRAGYHRDPVWTIDHDTYIKADQPLMLGE